MLGEKIFVEDGQDELEIFNTGVVVAIAKRGKSNSTVFARALDNDHNGEGTIFFLRKLSPDRDKSFIWSNEDVSKENLSIGSIVGFKRNGDESIHFSTLDFKPQDVTAIQMQLDYGEGAFLGTKDAFPSAKISPHKLLYMEDLGLRGPSIAAISMKNATIENERVEFMTKKDEEVNMRLLCRENLQQSTSSIMLQLRETTDADDVGDVALVTFQSIKSRRQLIYEAVCVGLLIRFKPKVISISEEPVKVKDGNGAFIHVPGNVLFDTGNTAATAVSLELVQKLGLQPDRRKSMKVKGIGDAVCQCSGKVSLDLVVRGHPFSIKALVGAVASGTDLLIGNDVIEKLIGLKFTFG